MQLTQNIKAKQIICNLIFTTVGNQRIAHQYFNFPVFKIDNITVSVILINATV